MRFWVDHIFLSKNIDQVFIAAGCGNINQPITIKIANSHPLWMLIYAVENRRVSKGTITLTKRNGYLVISRIGNRNIFKTITGKICSNYKFWEIP